MSAAISHPARIEGTPDYGIDAPGLVRFFFSAGSAASLLSAALLLLVSRGTTWGSIAAAALLVAAVYLIGMGCLMLYWSKVEKLSKREKTLDLVPWRGDELVLDVGCGRGLMLVGAALRLTTGRAVGIDIWSMADQSANGPRGAIDNARLEGVADKVEVQTADVRTLPFGEGSFDVVVSHWVVHNLEIQADRDTALAEMARVLRPGGYLLICDIAYRDAYMARLRELGFSRQRMIFSPIRDAILATLSFGTFRPSTICAQKSV